MGRIHTCERVHSFTGIHTNQGNNPNIGTTNGDVNHSAKKTAPAPQPEPTTPKEASVNGVDNRETTNGKDAKKVAHPETPKEDETKPQQSYLALTKLGAPVPRERKGSQ